MIGGIDIRMPTRCGVSSVEVAVRAVRHEWQQAVFENGLTGVRYDHFRDIPFGEIEEIFVYRDVAAADLWDVEGAVPAAHNTMLHIISDADGITVVVDEKDAEMEKLLAAIASALSDDVLYPPAQRMAA